MGRERRKKTGLDREVRRYWIRFRLVRVEGRGRLVVIGRRGVRRQETGQDSLVKKNIYIKSRGGKVKDIEEKNREI